MKKSMKLLTIGMILTLCAGFAACGGGSSSSSSSSSTPSGSTSTSTSTSSSTPELTQLSAPQHFEFYSEDNGKLMGLGYILEWEEVENATGYELRVNEQTLSSEEARFDLIHQVTVGQESEIWVKAKGNGTTYADSEEVTYTVTPKRADYGFSYEYDSELGGYLVSRGESMKTDIAFADRTHGNPIIGVARQGFDKEYTGVDVTSVTFSPSMKMICSTAFCYTSLSSVVIPGTVEEIDTAFSLCAQLREITFEEGVKRINGTFHGTALESVFIPASVEEMKGFAFGVETIKSITVSKDNPYYTSIDGNLYSKDGKTFLCYAGGKEEKEFTVPETVTAVGSAAFSYCPYLEKVTLHDGITKIQEEETARMFFYFCPRLTTIILSNALTQIKGLLSSGHNVKHIDYHEGITYLGSNTFSELESAVIPKSIQSIEGRVEEGMIFYYKVTATDWEKVETLSSIKRNAVVYFYSEDEPEGEGNFWHYNSEGEIEVWK